MAKRILIVDDQPYLRDVQVLLLREAGYAATAAANGFEALRRLDHEQPDLIVLDMSMPGMDGRQFLARLRTTAWSRLPIIVTTGHEHEEARAAVPGVDVLAKPYSESVLMEHVRRLIGDA